AWARPLEGPLAEEPVHERADVQPDLRPERFVVRLEDDPLGTAVQRLFDVQGRTANRHVLPVRGHRVRALERARAPHDGADVGERADAVHAEWVERSVLALRERCWCAVDTRAHHAGESGLDAGWG